MTETPQPQDLQTAQAIIGTLTSELLRAQREVAQLRRELQDLIRRIYGRKSEKVDPRQLRLLLEELGAEVEKVVEDDACEVPRLIKRRKGGSKGRQALPKGLPRERRVVDIPEAEKLHTGTIKEIGCWAHARRRFVEALEGDTRAATLMALIQQLYQVERDATDATSRLRLRQERSLGIIDQIAAERQRLEREALPKSPLGDAVRYLTNQWQALCRFTEDGTLEIDNNGAERQLRAVAVGRKNWLFAGSMAGAHRAAVVYSLIQSCRLVDVDPFRYLRDVLLRVVTCPLDRLAELTPQAWARTSQP